MIKKLFFCFIVFCMCSSGCTIHVKAKELEIDAEPPLSKQESVYEVVAVDILK